MHSLRNAREIARERKHGMTTAELAAVYHLPAKRVALFVEGWVQLRRETSPARPVRCES